jgi:hypothetical protein
MRRRKTLAILFCVLGFAAWSAPALPVAAQGGRQYIDATVVGINRSVSRSRPFRVIVEGYSSESDIRTLNEALQSGGQEEMLRALRRLDSGRISIGNNVGVTANAIIRTPTAEGGTKIQVIFERSVNFYELRAGSRRQDYRFGYAEMFVDRRGRGEGTFIPAARIRLRDGNTWEVEDFGVFPARLIGVRTSGNVPAR